MILFILFLFVSFLISLLKEAKHHIMKGGIVRFIAVVLCDDLFNLSLTPTDEFVSNLGLLERRDTLLNLCFFHLFLFNFRLFFFMLSL